MRDFTSILVYTHGCIWIRGIHVLNEELLNGKLELLNLVLQLASFICGDACCNHWSCDSTSTTKRSFGWNEHIWNVLVLSKQGQMKENLNWLCVSSHDDNFTDSSVESLCRCTICRRLAVEQPDSDAM